MGTKVESGEHERGIPKLIHRSHKLNVNEFDSDAQLTANLQSCMLLNPEYKTRYYGDVQVLSLLLDVIAETTDPDQFKNVSAAIRRLSGDPLSSVFVMRSDWFRLAALYKYGGWWLDGDVRCIDGIGEVLSSGALTDSVKAALELSGKGVEGWSEARVSKVAKPGACLFAWEGDLLQPVSAPGNWAFGCPAKHPFLQHAMDELVKRVLDMKYSEEEDPFSARLESAEGPRYVDVVHTTGVGMIGDALHQYAGKALSEVRRVFGEREDQQTWDRVSVVWPADPDTVGGALIVLPYCFFRSRGCAHLARNLEDRVIFHHEFEASWRTSVGLNYRDVSSDL